MGCEIGPRPSLRDSGPFGVQPSVETLGYSRLSLRDSKPVVVPCRQNGPGVQQDDLWVMTSPKGEGWGEGKGERRIPRAVQRVEDRWARSFHSVPPTNNAARCASS